MTVHTLDKIPFHTLMDCFLEAFKGYFVTMPTDHDYYKERWKSAGVDYAKSFGVSDGARLVGFIVHAMDHRNGAYTAFNSGTGVIPEYRGRQLVGKMYEEALPRLKQQGINRSTLEVITENTKAVRAYENVGFAIIKRYKCYHGTFTLKGKPKGYETKKVLLSDFDWSAIDQTHYSWDNHLSTLKKGNYDCFKVGKNGADTGYFVMDTESGYIAQFDVFEDREAHWEGLFGAIQDILETIRINNVDERLTSKIKYLNDIQLNNHVDQFEMELSI